MDSPHWTRRDVSSGAVAPVESVDTGKSETEANPYERERAMDRRREEKAKRRARLKEEVNTIIKMSSTPLRDIVRELVLPHLPVKTLLRFRAVSSDWNHLISLPIFRHAQSRTHRAASGVFQQALPAVSPYFPFDPLAGGIPDPFLSFLPLTPPFAVISSSNGLLCCAAFRNLYYVCNPSTAEWARLPPPPEPLSVEGDAGCTVEALVYEPSLRNLEENYLLVRGYQISDDFTGVYGFQTFSSETGVWRTSSDVRAVEKLIEGSGVSAGGAAYWRTTMQTMVSYDPATDSCCVIPWPMGEDPAAEWQLGEIDGRLCCTCVTDDAVQVYALAHPDHWDLLASFQIVAGDGVDDGEEETAPPVFRRRPRPLRFQSREPEVLLWESERLVGLNIVSRRLREAYVAPDQPWISPYADYVPHISTFARVFPKLGVHDLE